MKREIWRYLLILGAIAQTGCAASGAPNRYVNVDGEELYLGDIGSVSCSPVDVTSVENFSDEWTGDRSVITTADGEVLTIRHLEPTTIVGENAYFVTATDVLGTQFTAVDAECPQPYIR